MALTSLALFAQADWIITLLVLLGSFVVWLFNQIKAAQQEENKKKEVDDLADQVRDALGQGGRGEQGQTPPKRPPQRKKARPPVRDAPPQERAPLSSRPPMEGDPVEWDRPVPVSQHVRQHLDTQEFEQRTGSLGRLAELDDTVDEHVAQVFDHAVGTIGAEGGETEESAEELATATAAVAGISAMLSDPEQIANAIILQEVLRRPTWE